MLEKIKKNKRKPWQLYLLLLPGLVLVFIFAYIPMGGIAIAFKDFIPSRGIWGSEWVGLEHFRFMLMLPDTKRVVTNTVIIALMKIVIGFPIPIIFALLLNEVRIKFIKRSVQTIIYLPYFLSWVILGGIFIDIFSINGGIVNQFIGLFGIEPISFLGSNTYFRWVIVVTDIWKGFGFATVIYMASLSGIDANLYEAAIIDGAGRWKQTIHVTLPGIFPIVMLLAILNLGNVLNAGFDQIFNLYGPLVYETGDIIDTYVYRLAFSQANYGLSTAVNLFKSVVSFVFIVTGYTLAFKYSDYRIF